MSRDYEKEYLNSNLPDWMEEFVRTQLKSGKDYENSLQKNSKDSVESRVKDLQERVGLNIISNQETENDKVSTAEEKIPGGKAEGLTNEKFDKEQLAKGRVIEKEHSPDRETAEEIARDHLQESKDFKDGKGAKYYDKLEDMEKEIEKELKEKKSYHRILKNIVITASNVNYIVSLANALDEEGDKGGAEILDKKLNEITKDNKEDDKEIKKVLKVFKKFPKIKIFIDNVCKSRGGHVHVPAILKMLRDERPEEVNTYDDELKDYIINKIKEEKQEIPDDGDDLAGTSCTVFVVDENDENNKVFQTSTPKKQ